MQIDRPTAEQLIRLWGLELMATENVLYRQTYCAPAADGGDKPVSTAIIAMVTNDAMSFSDMHRLRTDELWHFYLGDPIELLLLDPAGRDELVVLGHDVLRGQRLQALVPAGVWMGARLRPGGQYGVFGTTMAPGFTQDDFEAVGANELVARWPHREDLIRAMTRDG
jgi:predicted cupin superfamily sugar epimerase